MNTDTGHYYPDIRDSFKKALIDAGMKQQDFDKSVSPSHINSVASGRQMNHPLRERIEQFIEDHE